MAPPIRFPAPAWLGFHRGHVLVRSGADFLAVPASLGSADITLAAVRRNPRVLRAADAAGLRREVDGLLDAGPSCGHGDRPELAAAGLEGIDVWSYQGRHYAVPAGEALEFERFRRRDYARSLVGHVLEDITDEVRRSARPAGVSEKVLFLANVAPSLVPSYLKRLEGREVTVLALPDNRPDRCGAPVIVLEGRGGGSADSFEPDRASPEMLRALREHGFDLVVVPYEGRSFWESAAAERLAAAVSNRLLNLFPGRRSRFYRGEDLRRIQYNKAYLASMFRWAPPLRGKRVLEVGTSDGLACDLILCEEPREAVGVDVMDMVGCAYPDPAIRYLRIEGGELPFEDHSFDVVFSIATLEHVWDPYAMVQEMKRVTAPGGMVYVQAGPLYFSPFGHHMFGHFDDVPWIHLRLDPGEIVDRARERGMEGKVRDPATYVRNMLDVRHVNGLLWREYGMDRLRRDPEVELLRLERSFEGESLLDDDVLREVPGVSREDLVSHGFEAAFRRRRG